MQWIKAKETPAKMCSLNIQRGKINIRPADIRHAPDIPWILGFGLRTSNLNLMYAIRCFPEKFRLFAPLFSGLLIWLLHIPKKIRRRVIRIWQYNTNYKKAFNSIQWEYNLWHEAVFTIVFHKMFLFRVDKKFLWLPGPVTSRKIMDRMMIKIVTYS